MLNWIKNYFNTLHQLQLNAKITNHKGQVISIDEGFTQYIQWVKTMHKSRGKLIIIGNGGSAGIASHLAIDYSKNGNIPALALNDASALTCLSNDYGYEDVFAKQIEYYGSSKDILVAISSSGKSKNILKAVTVAQKMGCQVITFSGFDPNNPLGQVGDLNFYIDSKSYGYVEVAHLSLGHALLDHIIEEQEAKRHQQHSLETV
jgi:D-sedoheptulose 7-phosphate isomerase